MNAKVLKDIVQDLGYMLEHAEVISVTKDEVTVAYSLAGTVFNTVFIGNGESYTVAKNGKGGPEFLYSRVLYTEPFIEAVYKHFLGKEEISLKDAKMLVKKAQEAVNDPIKRRLLIKELSLYKDSNKIKELKKIIRFVLNGNELSNFKPVYFPPQAFLDSED